MILLAATAAYLAWIVADAALHYPQFLLQVSGPVPGALLLVSFLAGVLISLYGARIPWRWSWGLASLAASLALLDLPGGEWAAVVPLAYATVFFGLTNAPKTGVLKGADYSYGIFLYGFAIQQTFVALAPWGRHWWINIAVCVPAATAVAALSWHLVEKPALGLRHRLARIEAKWLARPARASGRAGYPAA